MHPDLIAMVREEAELKEDPPKGWMANSRVAKEFDISEPAVKKLAEKDDCKFLYRLRNDPLVRKLSNNTKKIVYKNHIKW